MPDNLNKTLRSDITARDIAQMLRADPLPLCQKLFPNGRVTGGMFEVGSVNGEAGKTLKVYLRGAKQGGWADYARNPNEPGGKGDMLMLIEQAMGLDTYGAIQEAKRWLSIESLDPKALERQKERAKLAQERNDREERTRREKKRRNAEGLWRSSSELTGSSPPVRYLEHRGIDFSMLGGFPRAIRFKPDMGHVEKHREWRGPAMVTCFTNGLQITGAHVTWLDRRADGTWTKLPGVNSKKIFGPTYWGSHLPLHKGGQAHRKLMDVLPGTEIECSEGIEDGLSFAMGNLKSRVIAAGTLGNIGAIVLPPQAGNFNLLAQHDHKETAVRAREAVIKRQQEAAKRDGSQRIIACRWPPPEYHDWNDLLRDEPISKDRPGKTQ